MSYQDVVCGECHGDLECTKCRPTDTVVCHVCSCEVTVPWRMKPETFDPDRVRLLVNAVLLRANEADPTYVLLADAVRCSERK